MWSTGEGSTLLLILVLGCAAARGAAGPQSTAPTRLIVLLLEPGAAPLQCTPPAGSNATLLSLVARHSGGPARGAEQPAEYEVESMKRTVISGDAAQLTALATMQASAVAMPAHADGSARASAAPVGGAAEVALDSSGEAWEDEDFFSPSGGGASSSRRLQDAPAAMPLSLREEEPAMWAVLMAMAVLTAIGAQLVTAPVLWFGRSASAKYEDEGLVTGEGGEGGAYVATAQLSICLLQLAMLIQLVEPAGGAAAAGCAASSWLGHVGGAAIMGALLAKLLHLARVGDASELRVRLSDGRVRKQI
jgi:hypothetical protein